jgi:tetratricopeptide (TPR) repeat protein
MRHSPTDGAAKKLGCSSFGLVAIVACAGAPDSSGSSTSLPPTRLGAAHQLLQRGVSLVQTGDTVRTSQYLEAALDLGADTERVLPLLIAVYVRSGRYRLALDRAERHLASHPHDDRMRFLTGALHAALGSDARAAEHFERLLARLPSHAPAHYALAALLRDHYADAVGADRHFREYLRLDPGGPHAEEARASLLEDVE